MERRAKEVQERHSLKDMIENRKEIGIRIWRRIVQDIREWRKIVRQPLVLQGLKTDRKRDNAYVCVCVCVCVCVRACVYHSVRKESDLISCCKNLVDCNEAILNLHTHAKFFSCLLIASIDGKRHLSELGFSALVEFSL